MEKSMKSGSGVIPAVGISIVSHLAGFVLAAIALMPPLGYRISVVLDPFVWLYLVVLFGLIGAMLCFSKSVHVLLKTLLVYLWFSCFFSANIFASFNAFILFCMAGFAFVAFQKCDFNTIIRFIECVFWLQVSLVLMQKLGHDNLMNFGASYSFVNEGSLISVSTSTPTHEGFLGTVRQQMRLGSLFAIMAPFLVYKSRYYLIPLGIIAYLSQSAGFALALVGGFVVYAIMKRMRWALLLVVPATLLICLKWDFGSFESAWIDGRFRIWMVIVKTWIFNTSGPMGQPDFLGISQTGPFDLKSVLFGRGLDTFLPLFPIFKHDPNPFPQAHNCWLQLLWECGISGFVLFAAYYFGLFKRLYSAGECVLAAGLASMGINALSAFPTRMTQTVLLIVAFIAYCEVVLASKENENDTLYGS